MYKTLGNKIDELEKVKQNAKENEIKEIQEKIKKYQREMSKIKEMFPENFFEDKTDYS